MEKGPRSIGRRGSGGEACPQHPKLMDVKKDTGGPGWMGVGSGEEVAVGTAELSVSTMRKEKHVSRRGKNEWNLEETATLPPWTVSPYLFHRSVWESEVYGLVI